MIRCDKCKCPKEFYYLSDYSYGQRLIYLDDNKLAYIKLIDDDVYQEYIELVENIIKKQNINLDSNDIDSFVEKHFGDTCDLINNSKIDFTSGQKKCPNCGSQEFERNMIGPDAYIEMELPVVSHSAWKKLDKEQKENCILIRLKEDISF